MTIMTNIYKKKVYQEFEVLVTISKKVAILTLLKFVNYFLFSYDNNDK